jgi:hypothetical protein
VAAGVPDAAAEGGADAERAGEALALALRDAASAGEALRAREAEARALKL